MKKDKELLELGKSFSINEQTTVTETEEESALGVDADESVLFSMRLNLFIPSGHFLYLPKTLENLKVFRGF